VVARRSLLELRESSEFRCLHILDSLRYNSARRWYETGETIRVSVELSDGLVDSDHNLDQRRTRESVMAKKELMRFLGLTEVMMLGIGGTTGRKRSSSSRERPCEWE